jgi:hypothetical protein
MRGQKGTQLFPSTFPYVHGLEGTEKSCVPF